MCWKDKDRLRDKDKEGSCRVLFPTWPTATCARNQDALKCNNDVRILKIRCSAVSFHGCYLKWHSAGENSEPEEWNWVMSSLPVVDSIRCVVSRYTTFPKSFAQKTAFEAIFKSALQWHWHSAPFIIPPSALFGHTFHEHIVCKQKSKNDFCGHCAPFALDCRVIKILWSLGINTCICIFSYWDDVSTKELD